jgi:hypothetical protein
VDFAWRRHVGELIRRDEVVGVGYDRLHVLKRKRCSWRGLA